MLFCIITVSKWNVSLLWSALTDYYLPLMAKDVRDSLALLLYFQMNFGEGGRNISLFYEKFLEILYHCLIEVAF